MLLRCVDTGEANRLMAEVHSGDCGAHMNGFMLSILRMGYYWFTMEHDCAKYVRACQQCQFYADKSKAPSVPLNNMTTPWPFSMWGMDVIGNINPKASNGHRFILVAIDYFTKWVEAASFSSVTKSVVNRFIKSNIIARYGLPSSLITDNATNLNSDLMIDLCEKFKIEHHNSASYHPQMNGAVETANKNIKRIIEKMTTKYRDWHEMLPYAFLAYRTSIRTSTGTTPYPLVYGMEAVLPVEVEIPSLRILMEAELEETEWVQTRYDQLNIHDRREKVSSYLPWAVLSKKKGSSL